MLSQEASSSVFMRQMMARSLIFAGGIPLKRDGKVVGAIGVSGGSGDQDHAVAAAGCRRVLIPPDRADLQEENESMSHHYSGPDFGFPHADARLDFTDLYAFPKPGDTGEIHPDHDVHRLPAKILLGLLRPSPSHPRHCTSSRLTPMVMRLPISRTACASQLSSAAHKPRLSAALMARKLPVPAMAAG